MKLGLRGCCGSREVAAPEYESSRCIESMDHKLDAHTQSPPCLLALAPRAVSLSPSSGGGGREGQQQEARRPARRKDAPNKLLCVCGASIHSPTWCHVLLFFPQLIVNRSIWIDRLEWIGWNVGWPQWHFAGPSLTDNEGTRELLRTLAAHTSDDDDEEEGATSRFFFLWAFFSFPLHPHPHTRAIHGLCESCAVIVCGDDGLMGWGGSEKRRRLADGRLQLQPPACLLCFLVCGGRVLAHAHTQAHDASTGWGWLASTD